MMKKHFTLLSSFFLVGNLVFGQTTSQNAVASQLFKDVKTKLSVAEKNFIATKLGFVLSGDKTQPFALDKESKEFPFGATVFPADMNKDGKEEVFIVFGNSYTSGNTGSSVSLFIKNAAGIYTDNLAFPGMSPDVLTTMNNGYPDLLIGGPGFEFPVWRWNGKAYAFYKNVKDADYEKIKKTSLEQLSKTYQDSIQ